MNVLGIGAGGHAKVVIDTLRARGEVTLVGLLDIDPDLHGSFLLGIPVLGDDSYLTKSHDVDAQYFFVGVGCTGDMAPRTKLYGLGIAAGLSPLTVTHPQAVVSSSTDLGVGFTAMAASVVNADAQIGVNVLLNTGAIVEHDCVLGDHVHVATGARLAGAVSVEAGVHVGAGAIVRQEITLGEGAVIGAGAVVIRDVLPNTVVAGVPARVIRSSVK
jgi:UDP-perosamine 4-acetyltransferase